MTATVDAPTGTRALPWVGGLRGHGDRVAVRAPDGPVSYRELADRVDRLADRLAGPRRLVQVEGRTGLASVTALLAAHAAGHVVLLGAPGAASRTLRAAYPPDVVVDATGSVVVHHETPQHELHPDLALLVSTSGSTGAAKLVRLSADNLAANAAQIDEALGIRPDDCAALTLPITYCYGLSVLTTHLAAGATVLVTDTSVVDECFWRAAADAGVTTLPGVPHTFELLERSGFAERDLPSLRYLTQAGGRMDPDRVRRFAELGARRGFDLVVMYGQSEATARMTTLPADLAATHPDTVGVPVPGGSVEIVDGEIVFRGPNVMLGYAHGPDDLALGRTVDALRTGDLGELTPEGLLRVVGRTARFVKVLGHRIDLDTLERALRADGHDARCAGRDGLVALAVRGARSAPELAALRRSVARRCGIPRDAVRVAAVEELPVLGNGKPDTAAVLDVAERAGRDGEGSRAGGGAGVAGVYSAVLGRDAGPESTFVGLGGDSLAYVEASIRLEEVLGTLPPAWHVMTVAELERARVPEAADARAARAERPWWRRGAAMETSIWLRALAIVLIVGTHAHVFTLQGTANALLVIAGYQLARFQLAERDPARRSRRVLAATLPVAAPALVVIVTAHVLLGMYETRNLFLANWLFGEERLGPPWRFWFVEALVVGLVVVAALTRLPVLDRLDRRFPLGLPLALTLVAFLAFRVPWLPLPGPRMHGSALVVLHLLLLGWTLARASTTAQRLLVSGVVVALVGTFSGNHARDGLTIAVVLLMTWVPVTRVPQPLVPVVRVLAAASLYIYVIHWQALQVLWGHPVPAFVGSLALGLAYWWLWTRPLASAARRVRSVARTATARRAQTGTVDSSTGSPRTAPSRQASGRSTRSRTAARSAGQISASVRARSARDHHRVSTMQSRSSSV